MTNEQLSHDGGMDKRSIIETELRLMEVKLWFFTVR